MDFTFHDTMLLPTFLGEGIGIIISPKEKSIPCPVASQGAAKTPQRSSGVSPRQLKDVDGNITL